MKKIVIAGAIAAMASLSSVAAAAAPGAFKLTTGFDYSSGKYGGSQSTDMLYIPITGHYETGRWLFKLTVPYLRVTGPGNVVRGVGTLKTTTTTRTTESGLGDVVAGATYNVYAGTGAKPLFVDLTGKVKFGTADETKGLGTGKNDYAFQVDLYQSLGKFTPFGTIGYDVLGSPAGSTLNNVFYGSLGGTYKLAPKTSGGLLFSARQKASVTGAPQRDIMAFVTHKLDNRWKTQVYVDKGYADGSPDWEGGATISYAF